MCMHMHMSHMDMDMDMGAPLSDMVAPRSLTRERQACAAPNANPNTLLH